ncbi:MAG TPA: tyrosinase family protein [Blastocatellia bacterium]|nr:tyrosinase family protein [Blastocatellia bacterium]
MKVRRNLASLNTDERAKYVTAVKALKQKPYVADAAHPSLPNVLNVTNLWNWYVASHMQAMGLAHRAPAFLTWHRAFLLQLENDLGSALGDAGYALPYWDWAADQASGNPKQASVWQPDLMGGDGNPVSTGPFRAGQWTLYDGGNLVRAFGVSTPNLPTPAAVNDALANPTFDSPNWDSVSSGFRTSLERLHNTVHVWVGGSMLPMSSPDDPVFFLHHCNVDRIWAMWEASHPNDVASGWPPPGQGPANQHLDDTLSPWTGVGGAARITSRNMLDFKALGFTYETFRKDLAVNSKVIWQDSGVDIRSGSSVSVRYVSGTWMCSPGAGWTDANGTPRYIAKPGYAMPGVNEGALVGKIGVNGAPFLIGNSKTLPANQSGRLFLSINDDVPPQYGAGFVDNQGTINISIQSTL